MTQPSPAFQGKIGKMEDGLIDAESFDIFLAAARGRNRYRYPAYFNRAQRSTAQSITSTAATDRNQTFSGNSHALQESSSNICCAVKHPPIEYKIYQSLVTSVLNL